MSTGTQPIDGGHLIFTDEEKREFLAIEPAAEHFLRPYVSGEDYLYGARRWILILKDAAPTDIRNMPAVVERLRAVREFRSKSKRKSTLAIAQYPERFNVDAIPTESFLAIPEVSSETRSYLPIAWIEPPIVPSNKIRFIPRADLWTFSVLTSCMHMAWTRNVGGRLESRYQYSVGINYNPYPWPEASERDRTRIADLAQKVLDARAKFPTATLADLYDADAMPPILRKAHQDLDLAIDRLYRKEPFDSDRARVEHLLGLYEKLTAPILDAARKKSRRR